MEVDTLMEFTLDDDEFLELTSVDNNVDNVMDPFENYSFDDIEMLEPSMLDIPTDIAKYIVKQDTDNFVEFLGPQKPTEHDIKVISTDQQEDMDDNMQMTFLDTRAAHGDVEKNATSENTYVTDKALLPVKSATEYFDGVENTTGNDANAVVGRQMLTPVKHTEQNSDDKCRQCKGCNECNQSIDKSTFPISSTNNDNIKNTVGKNTHLIEQMPAPVIIPKVTDVTKNTAENNKRSLKQTPTPLKFMKYCSNYSKYIIGENLYIDGLTPVKINFTELTNTAKDTTGKNTDVIDTDPIPISNSNSNTKCNDVANGTAEMLVSVNPTEPTDVTNNKVETNMDFIDRILVPLKPNEHSNKWPKLNPTFQHDAETKMLEDGVFSFTKDTFESNENVNVFVFMSMPFAGRTLLIDRGLDENSNPFILDTILAHFSIILGNANIMGLENCLNEIEEMSKLNEFLLKLREKILSKSLYLNITYYFIIIIHGGNKYKIKENAKILLLHLSDWV